MLKYNSQIDINKITGNSINIPLLLTQKGENIGLLEDLSTNLDTNDVNVTVTGTTQNRLSEVRSFDYNNPYSVGKNGVSEVTADYVKYTIDGIDYVTFLSDMTTSFSFTTTRSEYINNNFISEDANLTYVDRVDVQDSVFIERQNISVIENFSKLRQISSVSEIEGFSDGFYKINNQTI